MQPNEALLRESYEGLERGDWEAVANTLADDFVLAVAGRNPLAGETRGRDANIARQQRIVQLDYARVTYDRGGNAFHVYDRERVAYRGRQAQRGARSHLRPVRLGRSLD
jgi:ketosteroid isomerase-like protein